MGRQTPPHAWLITWARLIATLALMAGLASLAGLAGLVGPGHPAAARAQAGGAAPGIGESVPFVGTEGGTLAEITVEAIADPFQDYDPGTPPQRSYHYVLLTVTVENTGSRPFAFDPNALAVQDADGFLARPQYLPRTEESLAGLPDFPTGDIPPGETATGGLAVQALNGTDLLHVVYLPESDRLVVLASLSEGDAENADDSTPAAIAATNRIPAEAGGLARIELDARGLS